MGCGLTRLLLLSVLGLGLASAARGAPPEETESRADLRSLLKLPGKLLGSEGADLEPGWSGDFTAFFERYGITPEIGGVVSGSGWGFGLSQSLWHDAASTLGWHSLRTFKGYQEFGIFYARRLDTAGRVTWTHHLRHRDLPQEDFYGFGLESERGNRTDFRLTENRFRSELGIRVTDTIRLDVHGDLWSVRARGGENDAYPSPGVLFGADAIPGYRETSRYGGVGLGIVWDTRDNPGYARRGTLVAGELEGHFGLDGSSPSFRRFAFELENALPLPGADHALVTRLSADVLQLGESVELPFFLTRGLGGSHTLRSFPLHRFRGEDVALATVEYRHAIWKDNVDAAVFWDMGGVYDNLGSLSFDSLRHSYGVGIRFLKHQNVLLRLELARGAEGTRVVVSFSSPF